MANSRTILIVGIGNPLRGDDGVGPWTANQIAALRLPGVETIAVHQLVPELAARLADFASVIFVDAVQHGNRTESLQLRRIEPETAASQFCHRMTPARLLEMAKVVGDRTPEAWLLTIPVSQFGVGERLSPDAIVKSSVATRMVELIAKQPERADPSGTTKCPSTGSCSD